MDDKTILLVDDEQNVLKSLKRLFIDTNYTIVTALSGEEGFKILENRKVQLVISDYRMPALNGVQFLSKVRDSYPDTIRIILSGYADVSAIVEAINEGHIYKFIAKPWNDQELLTTVKTSLEYFNLRRENDSLLHDLRDANKELRAMTVGLESKVKERTKDLDLKNKALEIARSILGTLPVGVLGVDADLAVVYMNESLGTFIDTGHLSLGESIPATHWPQLHKLLKETLRSEASVSALFTNAQDTSLLCTPLNNKVGAIATFTKTALANDESRSSTTPVREGVVNE